MENLFIMIGISGSGKSTYCKEHFSDSIYISTDEIRKEFTGDVSNLTKDNLIFSEFHSRIEKAIGLGKNIVCDATNLKFSCISDILKYFYDLDTNLTLDIMCDSIDWELCLNRVKAQLSSGCDRSNTDVMVSTDDGDSIPLLQNMGIKFKNMLCIENCHPFTNYLDQIKDRFTKKSTIMVNFISNSEYNINQVKSYMDFEET